MPEKVATWLRRRILAPQGIHEGKLFEPSPFSAIQSLQSTRPLPELQMEGLIVLVVYILGGLLLVGLGFLLYARAVASRQATICSQCGERQTVELMSATRCNTCGAPLNGKRA